MLMKNQLAFKVLLVIMVFATESIGQAQRSSVFPSYVIENPQRFGEGIFKHVIKSDNYFRQGQFEAALNELDYALSQDPYFAEVYIKRAIIRHKIGRIAEAREDYERAKKINPYASELYGFNGPLRRMKVLASDYEHWLEERLSSDSSEDLKEEQINGIITQKRNGDILGALSELNVLIDISRQTDPMLLKMRGNIHILLDQHFDAINDFSQAISIDPELKEAYFNRGIAKIMAYNRSDACYDIQESVQRGYEKGKEILQYFCNF